MTTNVSSATHDPSASRAQDTPAVRALDVAGYIAGALVGLAFLVAVYTKAVDPVGFSQQMIRENLVPFAGLAHPLAIFVVAIEALIGIALLINVRRLPVLGLSTLLMGFFLGLSIWQYFVPPEDPSSCGCFGNFVQQDPAQHVLTNAVLFGLTLVAWLGWRRSSGAIWRWAVVVVAFFVAGGFAMAAPSLPIDGWPGVTKLVPGAQTPELAIDEALSELRHGLHLVLLIDRADESIHPDIARVNEHLALAYGEAEVWALAEENPELEMEFMFTAAPAFEVRGVPYGMMKPLFRSLPRAFVVNDGEVEKVWNGVPSDEELKALAEGRIP